MSHRKRLHVAPLVCPGYEQGLVSLTSGHLRKQMTAASCYIPSSRLGVGPIVRGSVLGRAADPDLVRIACFALPEPASRRASTHTEGQKLQVSASVRSLGSSGSETDRRVGARGWGECVVGTASVWEDAGRLLETDGEMVPTPGLGFVLPGRTRGWSKWQIHMCALLQLKTKVGAAPVA